MEHGACVFLDFADLTKGDFIREAAEVITGGDNAAEGSVGGARQHDEHGTGEDQDADGDKRGGGDEAGGNGFMVAGEADGLRHASADFRAGGCGDSADEIDGEIGEEVEVHRKHGRGDKFDEGDGSSVQIIAVCAGSEDLHDGEEADQMDGGFEEAAREEEIVGGEEGDVGDGDEVDGEIGDVQFEEAGDDGSAEGEAEGDEEDGGGIEEVGAGDG